MVICNFVVLVAYTFASAAETNASQRAPAQTPAQPQADSASSHVQPDPAPPSTARHFLPGL